MSYFLSFFFLLCVSKGTIYLVPVPVAARSVTLVYGHLFAVIASSNPAGDVDVCLLRVLCVVRERSMRRADHLSRGVLPTVVRRCV